MPLYDVQCESHGVREIHAPVAAAMKRVLTCPDCGIVAPQFFNPASLPNARVDASGEVRANDRDPRTRGMNLGLGVPAAQVDTNSKRRDFAARNNMSAVEGAYRSLPR